MFAALVALVLSSGPSDWPELRREGARAVAGKPPKPFQRRDALDEMQATLGQWQKERREFARDVDERKRLSERRSAPGPIEVPEAPPPVMKKGAKKSRYGKIIEVAPETPPKEGLDAELERAEQ